MYQHKKYINTNFYCTVNLNNILSPNNDIKVLQKGLSDTINSNTFRCNTKTCKSQFGFYPSDNVISFVIKKIYDFVTPPVTMYLNCHSPYIFNYLLQMFTLIPW